MKSFCLISLVVTALAALPATAEASGITYDCDTAADHFSELALPAPSSPFKVTGNVQLNSLAASAKYAATVRIQIASAAVPGRSPDAYAGITLSALPADPKKTPSGSAAIQMLSYTSNGAEDEVLPLSMLTKPGTLQPFTLSYDGQRVHVIVGNESKNIPLRAQDPVVRIVCSTGEFLVTDLVIFAGH